MHAYLFTGEQGEVLKKIDAFIQKDNLKRIDFPLTSIKEIKELSSLAQIPFGAKTAIVIGDFEKVSIEAQNAFLKELEEPQRNLTFILSTSSEDKVLPTITSRCEIISVVKTYKPTKHDVQKIEDFIKAAEGEKLKIISKITDRESAKAFLKNLMHVCERGDELNKITANKADITLQRINQNANPTLQLTDFVLSLDKSH